MCWWFRRWSIGVVRKWSLHTTRAFWQQLDSTIWIKDNACYLYVKINFFKQFSDSINPCVAVCGPRKLIPTNKTQVLTSPNYPKSYVGNLRCTWTIEVNNEFPIISLRFTKISLSETKDCLTDYLELKSIQVIFCLSTNFWHFQHTYPYVHTGCSMSKETGFHCSHR